MNVSAGPTIPHWTWMRWLVMIAIVFVIHVTLIFTFGARKPPAPLPVENVPSLALVAEPPGGWLALNNATLFALPDRDGFAGPEWVAIPPLAFTRQDWTEPPRWLALPASELGAAFKGLVETNRIAGVHFEFNTPPPLAVPAIPTQLPLETNSTLQIEGEITKRPLLSHLKLPAWPYSGDVIAPSVVQVLVDAAGNVVSAVLLPPQNDLETSDYTFRDNHDADRYAVALARAARFTPLASDSTSVEANPSSSLTVGRLIFNWQTVPVTTTNAIE